MKVRDIIEVSRVPSGELDVPLIFELDEDEKMEIYRYLYRHVPKFDEWYNGGRERRHAIIEAAERLAERGMPQAITALVIDHLAVVGDGKLVGPVDPFPCPRSKVSS